MDNNFQNKNFATIDILKGLAMIMIIVTHYSQNFIFNTQLIKYLRIGCSIFFVVSGFDIAKLISERYNKKEDWKKFFYQELKRL